MTKDSKYLLRLASKAELKTLRRQHHAYWGGGLDVNQYLGREELLASQALTHNGGIACWVLTTLEDKSTILTSCETIKKKALVVYPSLEEGKPLVKDVVSHVIGSVFTPQEHRKSGYASIMIKYLEKEIRAHGIMEEACSCNSGNIRCRCLLPFVRSNLTEALLPDDGELEESPFSVLYSDIGKTFYAKLGWLPYRSSHISLPPHVSSTTPQRQTLSEFPESIKLLEWDNARMLCDLDCIYIQGELENTPIPQGVEAKVAFLPTWQVIRWHHAREEYVGKFLRGRSPKIKGACTNDGKQWCIWTRTFAPHDMKLTILRFADWKHKPPLKEVPDYNSGVNLTSIVENETSLPEEGGESEVDSGLVSLVQAARKEAHDWGLPEVIIWNPTERLLKAAERAVGQKVKVINRKTDSIASLKWDGRQKEAWNEKSIIWEYNEKFAWC